MALLVKTARTTRALGPTAVAKQLAKRLGMPTAMYERHKDILLWLARTGSPAQLRQLLA